MSESKHTPAPWNVDKDYDIYAGDPKQGTRVDIATISWFRNQNFKANARLIAAAPELLEALEECLDAIDLCTPDAPEPLPNSIIGKARAAIAKARE